MFDSLQRYGESPRERGGSNPIFLVEADQEFQRWYKPPDLSVESIQNCEALFAVRGNLSNPQAPAFIRGVNLKSKI